MWASFKNNRLGKQLQYALDKKDVVSLSDTKAVGILLDVACFADVQRLQEQFKRLKVAQHPVQVLVCNPEKVKVDNEEGLYFFERDVSKKGEVKATSDTATFLKNEYHVLINYFTEPSLEFSLVSALTKAKIRVGFQNKETRINDINIDADPQEIDTFVEVVKNYLPKIK